MSRPITGRAKIIPLLAEVFRDHGYDGASLTLIGQATGLGKSSLYHLFPNGKEQMAAEVLAEIDRWFEVNVFSPLRDEPDPRLAIRLMLARTDAYFLSGQRVCLVGTIALVDARDHFTERVRGYFAEWIDTLTAALVRAGHSSAEAAELAEETVAGVQGALVLARALNDVGVFSRAMDRIGARLV